MTDELPQGEAARPPLERRAPQVFDVGAARFDDAAVRDAGRAHALARSAAKAEVDVLDLLLVKSHGPALPLRHQVDAAARGFGLQSGDPKGRTRVEAQTAVDAGREVVVRQAAEWSRQTTNRPGFKTWSGSNACLRRRMMSMVGGGVPHAPTSRMKSSGAAIMTRLPPAVSVLARTSFTEGVSDAIAQCATPIPGEAHQPAPLGSPSTSPRSADRGAAMRAHRAGARRWRAGRRAARRGCRWERRAVNGSATAGARSSLSRASRQWCGPVS